MANRRNLGALRYRSPPARLDPERTRAARRAYDDTGHFAAWSACCRTRMTRPVDPPPSDILARRGYEIVPVLSIAEAASVRMMIQSLASTTRTSKKDIDYADIVQFDDSSFPLPVVERIRSRDMDARLVSHFRSEYFFR